MPNPVTQYNNARSMVRCGASVVDAAEAHSVDQAVLACLVDGERRMRKGVVVWADTHTHGRERAKILKRHGANVQVRVLDDTVTYWVPVADCTLAEFSKL
jgi:hypothetical protein